MSHKVMKKETMRYNVSLRSRSEPFDFQRERESERESERDMDRTTDRLTSDRFSEAETCRWQIKRIVRQRERLS